MVLQMVGHNWATELNWTVFLVICFSVFCFSDNPTDASNLISGSSAFLNPAWISGSSQFTNYWSLAWRILRVILLACEMSAIVCYLNTLWHCLSFGLEWKLTFSSHCWVFQICWHIECSTLTMVYFVIWSLVNLGMWRHAERFKTHYWFFHECYIYVIYPYTSLYYIHQNYSVYRHKNWRRQWHPTPVLLPGKSHGQRSLVGCSPWGRTESDTTEWLHFHFSLFMHWRRKWQPTPLFLPGESQGQRSLVGCHL